MKKLGLALGGGAARGFAHIGVLKALEEVQIPVGCVAGTSMGGIIAAAYAMGKPLDEIEELALSLSHVGELIKLVDITPPRRGLLNGARVQAFLARLFDEEATFADTAIPLALTAVDLVSAREILLTQGPLLPAVLATCAMPGLFVPREMEGMRLVDGGVLDNVPAELARKLGAEVVMAVDVQHNPCEEPPWQDLPNHSRWAGTLPEVFLDFYRAELMMIAEMTRSRLAAEHPDLLLRVPLPPDLTMFLGFSRASETIEIGRQAALEAAPLLMELIQA